MRYGITSVLYETALPRAFYTYRESSRMGPASDRRDRKAEFALELHEITRTFPGVLANDKVTLRFHAGSIHGLLGENGTGKTTLMRIAYGSLRADSGSVLRLVVGRGMLLTVAGLVVGLALALALSRFAESLLFEVSARDPLTFVLVPLALVAVAFAACYLPALRAARVDPVVALRSE